MYAAMQCGEEVQDKILSVYDNDGPGFPEGFSMERYREDPEKSNKDNTGSICDRHASHTSERTGDRRQHAERNYAA